jgi:hypothetical protein
LSPITSTDGDPNIANSRSTDLGGRVGDPAASRTDIRRLMIG